MQCREPTRRSAKGTNFKEDDSALPLLELLLYGLTVPTNTKWLHDGDQPDDRCEQAVAAAVGCPGGQGDDGEEPAPCGGQCPGIVHPSYRI